MTAPRLLPLVGVAVGGVLAVKLLAGAQALPDYLQGARAWAEGTTGAAVSALKSGKAIPGQGMTDGAAKAGLATLASAVPPPRPPAPVCAPTAAELAKEAGLSPAELQTLQSLGARRGQLDEREKGLETQLALINAAAVKLDGKIAALNGLKADIQGLMGQASAQKTAEVDRLVIVYSAMKPKDAAARMTLLDDDVRLPIAMKMKERTLAAILAQMPPADAKALTEKLAARMDPKLAAARAALAAQQTQQAQAQPAAQPQAGPAAKTRTAAAKPSAAPTMKPPVKTAEAGSTDPIGAEPAAARSAAARPAHRLARAKSRVRPQARPGSPTAAALAAYATPRPYASLQPAIGLPTPKVAQAPATKMAAAQPTGSRPAPQSAAPQAAAPQAAAPKPVAPQGGPKPAASIIVAPKPATGAPAAAAAAKSS